MKPLEGKDRTLILAKVLLILGFCGLCYAAYIVYQNNLAALAFEFEVSPVHVDLDANTSTIVLTFTKGSANVTHVEVCNSTHTFWEYSPNVIFNEGDTLKLVMANFCYSSSMKGYIEVTTEHALFKPAIP
jgi:ribosomal protein L31